MLIADDIVKTAQEVQCGLPDGRYVCARPIQFGGILTRLLDAWEVIAGRADAVRWLGQ
jgi:hypothetical protein